MRGSVRNGVLVIALAIACVSSGARAQAPTADEPTLAAARDAFRLGSDLARQGQWSDALAAFERSSRLHPHASTLYNVGYCERALGRLTRARRAFAGAVSRDRGVPEGELTAAQREALGGYLQEIDRKVARAVVASPTEGTRVAIDGKPLEVEDAAASHVVAVAGTREPGPPERAPAGTFDVVLDPGDHLVAIELPDGRSDVRTERFEAGEVRRLDLVLAPTPSEPPRPTPAERPSGPPSSSAFVAFGVGAAGVTAGLIAGAIALEARSQVDAQCEVKSECPRAAGDDIDRMRTSAGVSTVAIGIGLANVALGVGLYFGARGPGDAPAVAPMVSLVVSEQGAVVRVGACF
jgi:hypothetical protein